MRNHLKDIEEDLTVNVGLRIMYYCGSDTYAYYISEILPGGVLGIYEPNSNFENDWTDGYENVDPFDSTKESEFYIRKSYGNWWKCDKNGKRIGRWHRNISFRHAS